MSSSPLSAEAWWSKTAEQLFAELNSTPSGLSTEQAEARRLEHGPNTLEQPRGQSAAAVLWAQVRNPLVLLLVFAAIISGVVSEWTDTWVVLSIVVASVGVGFWREYRANLAMKKLLARITLRTDVLRDGKRAEVPTTELVPGDVVLLAAGSLIPADGVLVESNDFFVNEAVLTGESYPVEKQPGIAEADASISHRKNALFRGTNVRSGTGKLLIVSTGAKTEFGEIAKKLALGPPETEFDRGLRHFGTLLLRVMLVMTLVVFAANVLLDRPVVDALLFSVALAVGLAPELLPAILTVNLARSAQSMANEGVLVRRLNAIENLGSMDVLCTDKTGTITVGVVRLDASLDPFGKDSEQTRSAAMLNARFQTGLPNPMDEALLRDAPPLSAGVAKLDELPYDFTRKRLSVVVEENGVCRLITKGAFDHVLEVCTRLPDGSVLDDAQRDALRARYVGWGSEGFRVLGVASAEVPRKRAWHRADEQDLTFLGFLLFFDPPKPGVEQILDELASLGVSVKIITGDAKPVAAHAAQAVGMKDLRVMSGEELHRMHEEALFAAVPEIDVFAEVDPNQKERIILALKKRGHVVGYMGDGINDAPALHAADAGVSVDNAVDVAREAADFVLLKHDLEVLHRGILAGRKTFANTLKYVLTSTSANLGNMVSMAFASLALPFLPLTAGQILLNNFLSDIPAFSLANDDVDRELIEKPRRWDMTFLGRFMVLFGLLSSLFDFLTFGALLLLYRANADTFRTGWFVESLLTELLVALVVRTRRPAWKSRPTTALLVTTFAVALVDIAIPYLPYARELDFVPLPWHVLLMLLAITGAYVLGTELLKRSFYKWVDRRPSKLPGAPTHRRRNWTRT